MSYEKQTWATGDTITAAKLNHIEDGIENAGGMAIETTYNEGTGTYDSTVDFTDVVAAFKAGTNIVVHAPKSSVTFHEVWDTLMSFMPKDEEDEYSYDYFKLSDQSNNIIEAKADGNGKFILDVYID